MHANVIPNVGMRRLKPVVMVAISGMVARPSTPLALERRMRKFST